MNKEEVQADITIALKTNKIKVPIIKITIRTFLPLRKLRIGRNHTI